MERNDRLITAVRSVLFVHNGAPGRFGFFVEGECEIPSAHEHAAMLVDAALRCETGKRIISSAEIALAAAHTQPNGGAGS